MFLYQCFVCNFSWVSHPVRQLVETPHGPQWQFFCPNCPNCMYWRRGYGKVVCHGEYILAPMNVVQGQPVYNMHPPTTTPTAQPKPNPPSSGPTASVQTAVVATQPKPPEKALEPRAVEWSKGLGDGLTQYVMKFLDDRSLALVARVCTNYRRLAVPLLLKFVPPMVAHGSALGPLKGVVQNELRSVKTLSLAVDKFSPDRSKGSILSCLIKLNAKTDLMLGTPNQKTTDLLSQGLKNFRSLSASDQLHKMHNKFWILDRNAVITGSPNVSFSGLEGGNLETFIIIRSARVASLFSNYLKLLQSGDPFKGTGHDDLKQALLQYNSEEHQLKLAMAPVINITDFVLENLKGATKITIRQFLISPKPKKNPGTDILSVLCGMAETGVDIEIYLDESQYENQDFVQRAVTALLRSGCKVYLQKPVVVINAGAEGLMHDKLILATLHGGIQRTLLGSAGFTLNVIANENAENFICTDVKGIYDACLRHHEESLKASAPRKLV